MASLSNAVDKAVRVRRARERMIASTNAKAGMNGPPRLVVSHLEARNLLARDIRKDLTATSDPIAFLFCGTEQIKTGVMLKALNPFWKPPFYKKSKETGEWVQCDEIIFGVDCDILNVATLHIQIKDDDNEEGKIGTGSKFDNLGGIQVDLVDMLKSGTRRKKLQWYDLEIMEGMVKVQGQVRLSLRYTGRIEEQVDSQKMNTVKEVPARPVGTKMKKREKPTKKMEEFQAQRAAAAEARELAALKKAQDEHAKVKQAEEEKEALQLELQKAKEEKQMMAAQMEIMKDEQEKDILLSSGVLNPEETDSFRRSSSDQLSLEREVTRSLARLKHSHTRTIAMAELHAMAEGFFEKDMPVVLGCLRVAFTDHDGNFQRECVKFINLVARTSPAIIAPYLDETIDAICSRINAAHETVHAVCVETIGSLARYVLPILNRGRVKPTFSSILDPLLEMVRQQGSSALGQTAARCLIGAFTINIPRRATTHFKILGLSHEERSIEVARRMFRAQLSDVPFPKHMTLGKDGCLLLEVSADTASSYYQKLLDSSSRMPPGWCLAASADATAAAVAAKTAAIKKTPGFGGSVPEKTTTDMAQDGNLMRSHVILLGGCGRQIFQKISAAIPSQEGETRAALLDALTALVDAAAYGESRRIRRLSNAVAVAAPILLQRCVDTLLQKNKSWNWKSRRAALALLGKTARLHGITLNNGQILKSVQIIDGEVDIVVVLKTIKDCSCDRVNVVRETASKAMVEFDEADLIPEAFKARFAPKKDRSPAYIKPATDGKHSKLSIMKKQSPQNQPKLTDGNERSEYFLRDEDVRKAHRDVHRQPETKLFPTRYKTKADPSFNGIDESLIPPPPELPASASNATCLKKLNQPQRNSLQRVTVMCSKRPSMVVSELRKMIKTDSFVLVVPHLFLHDSIKLLDEKFLTSIVCHFDQNLADRVLHVLAETILECVDAEYSESNELAVRQLLKWVLGVLNTCKWAVEVIVGQNHEDWGKIKRALRMLGGTTSNYSGATNAAKLFALLTMETLLDSHLYIFGDGGDED